MKLLEIFSLPERVKQIAFDSSKAKLEVEGVKASLKLSVESIEDSIKSNSRAISMVVSDTKEIKEAINAILGRMSIAESSIDSVASSLENHTKGTSKTLKELRTVLETCETSIGVIAAREQSNSDAVKHLSTLLAEPQRNLDIQAAEINRLKALAADPESQIRQKSKIIAGLLQWITKAHRLDVPMQPNTIRNLLEKTQHEKPAETVTTAGTAAN